MYDACILWSIIFIGKYVGHFQTLSNWIYGCYHLIPILKPYNEALFSPKVLNYVFVESSRFGCSFVTCAKVTQKPWGIFFSITIYLYDQSIVIAFLIVAFSQCLLVLQVDQHCAQVTSTSTQRVLVRKGILA